MPPSGTDRALAPVRVSFILALLFVLLAPAGVEAQPKVIPRSPSIVVDAADVIPPDREQFLVDGLLGFETSQQRRVSVVTVPDLQGYEIADYGAELGRVWGLRDSSNNDGAILIVAPREMKVRIEVGSAVQSDLPDEVAREIIQTWIVPSFEQGDLVNGTLNGAGAILVHLELSPQEAAAIAEQARIDQELARQAERESPWLALVGIFLLVIVWAIVRRFLGFAGLASGAIFLIGAVGGGGGGGGRFGGFGGGGGGFNGGGAGGRW